MRLSVFIPQATPQLFTDLKKIYQDHLADNQLTDKVLLSNFIENAEKKLFVTMFNERHLGSVMVSVTNDVAELSMLSIREVTRRRGIAKNLLKEVEKHLISECVKTITLDLNNISDKEAQGLCAFMLKNNYQRKDNCFIKGL